MIRKGGTAVIKTDITLPIGYASSDIKQAIAERLPVSVAEIGEAELLRRTLDLSDTTQPHYKCTVAFSVGDEREQGLLKMRNKVFSHIPYTYSAPCVRLDFRPIVVGAGPAGLFAALVLAEAGARPIVLERGQSVAERERRVKLFNTLGILDPECNVQFGEGGAGTFSDGKLKVGGMDAYKMKVLEEFIAAGASEDIAFSATAHLGTDCLPGIISLIREKIISLGGEFIFGARVSDVKLKDGALSAVVYEKGGERLEIDTRASIFAIGHSARDTIKMLYSKGIPMQARGFGIGVRIEHPREYINSIVYRDAADIIPETASYHLVTHLPSGRSVYSFCMCPGGSVVAAASEEDGIVTNGMSEYARMGDNSNAALLVSVTPSDFGSDSPLAGIEYQRIIEERAYNVSGGYRAPTTILSSLMSGQRTGSLGSVAPSYPVGVCQAELTDYLPEFISDSLRAAIPDFDAWLPGYLYPDAVLTGPETRTTSPVRIERTDVGESPAISGIFPAGEGAGYAGGIVSSAVDGMREAERLLLSYNIN